MNGRLCQLFTAVASSFGQLLMGLLNVWPSYTAGIYASNSTTPLSEPMSQAEESLLGSLPSLGAMVGTGLVSILMNRLGRKNGGIVLSLPFVISWAMISVTTSSKVVLVARFLSGVAGGGFLVYSPIFISEIAEDSFRGTLASGPVLFYTMGTLLSYILGWMLSYRIIIWINIITSVFCTMLVMSVRESPVYFIKQKRDEDAKEAIAYYRGASTSSVVVMDEFSKLKSQLTPPVELISVTGDSEKADEAEKEKLNSEYVQPEEQKKMSPIKMLFVSPSCLRAFLVVFTVISIQVMMGMVPVQVYAKKVFMQTNPEQADLYTVVFALVLLCGCLVTTVIADKAGRRILIITSSVLVAIFMAVLGYLLQSQVAPAWVTVVVIMMYCFSFMFGAGSVPYVLLAEVFVSEVQNLASMLIVEWVWFLNFFILAIFPPLNRLIGIHGSFYCFAAFAVANSIISFFVVPETKGLSKEQIQEKLLGKRKN